MFSSIPTPTRTRSTRLSARDASGNPWQLWSIETPAEHEVLSVAELAECRCPDICDRDHANE